MSKRSAGVGAWIAYVSHPLSYVFVGHSSLSHGAGEVFVSHLGRLPITISNVDYTKLITSSYARSAPPTRRALTRRRPDERCRREMTALATT